VNYNWKINLHEHKLNRNFVQGPTYFPIELKNDSHRVKKRLTQCDISLVSFAGSRTPATGRYRRRDGINVQRPKENKVGNGRRSLSSTGHSLL